MDEMTMDETSLETLARRAADGERVAAEALLAAVSGDVYNLALRMLGHVADAEDAAQEILLILLTHLGSFEGRSAFRTWVWRIASRHLLRVRQGRREQVSFDAIAGWLAEGEAAATPDTASAEQQLLVREIEIGCTQGMLLALGREERVAFILVELLGLSGDEAAAVLELAPAALRKRVSRARARLGEFMRAHCGIVDEANACRCARQLPVALAHGLVEPGKLQYATHPVRVDKGSLLAVRVRELDHLQRAVDVFRAHPDYAPPSLLTDKIRDLIESGRFGVLDA
jgi:RNA polymerase sigma factor (sigma-70 family)